MGTMADKLQAILDSKAAIKTAINNKGGTITDSTPLDEYATKIGNIQTIDAIVDRSISGTYINSTATTIINYTFSECNNLIRIDLLNATEIKSNAFYKCNNLETVNLPLCTLIGNYVFSTCNSLVNVYIPEVTSLGNVVFSYSTALVSINIPRVTTIGQGLFTQCTNLQNVEFGENLTSLNISVFQDCTSLQSVKLNYNGVVSLPNSTNTFLHVTGPVIIYVPASQISSYQTATNWSTLYNNSIVTFSAIV